MRSPPARAVVVSVLCASSLTTLACTSTLHPEPFIDPNIVSETDLRSLQAYSVYDALQYSRPRFLTTHVDLEAGAQRQVYLDGTRLGGIDQLRGIPVSSIRQIRFVRSVDVARGVNGTGGGAIVLISRNTR